jgi:FkbM family methyltransferase
MDSYAQHGEDLILWRFFGGRREGMFVDVGAHDGITFSNTYLLEQQGWRGVCIEPNPDVYPTCWVNRRKSVCIMSAVGEREGIATLHRDVSGLFASLVSALPVLEVDRISVRTHTLDGLLDGLEWVVPKIDFISIDVEGMELAVLRGFDVARWQPRVLIIEANTDDARAELVHYMGTLGYAFARAYNQNCIFVKPDDLVRWGWADDDYTAAD